MHFDSVTGWVRGVRHCPSPNFNLRPQGDAVSLLVIHNISLPPGQFGTGKVQAFFQNRLDPNEHPYFEGDPPPDGFRAFPHRTRRRHHPVRLLSRPRLACRGFLLRRSRGVQRLLPWHRTGGDRHGTVHGRAVHCPGRADAAVARGLPGITRNASRATAISPRSARPIPARLSTGRATAPD